MINKFVVMSRQKINDEMVDVVEVTRSSSDYKSANKSALEDVAIIKEIFQRTAWVE